MEIMLTLKKISEPLARLPQPSEWPQWATEASQHFETEQGILCSARAVPERVGYEAGWRGFEILTPSNRTSDYARAYHALPEQILSMGFQQVFIHNGPVGNIYLFVLDPNNVAGRRIRELCHSVTD